MRTARLAFALVLAAGCGDDGSAVTDAPPGGDGGGNDSGIDAPPAECTPDPLPACASPINGTNITLNQVGTASLFGGDAALLVTSPPNDPRLFVVGRNGQIKIVKGEDVNPEPFFDLTTVDPAFADGGERGLLGLAFHPLYACKREFYIFYTTGSQNVVSRCTASLANPDLADSTCTRVLEIPDFAGNHNGGMMEFGADGYLYIGTGDGGGGGDPRRNGQALQNVGTTTVALLGKMLRIDIDVKDAGKQYSIPASNPFAGGGGAPEIWMYGLRNPWRWSFDRETGDMWIGDVGQILTEELTAVKAGEQSGKNLGWSIWEGDGCCADQGTGEPGTDDGSPNGCEQNGTQQVCDMNAPALVFPQDVRRHPTWISVIAGQTYRGTCYPDLVGWHLYTDHNSNAAGLHRARFMTGSNDLEIFNYPQNAPSLPSGVTSIHADARGELYLTRLDGRVYHLEAGP